VKSSGCRVAELRIQNSGGPDGRVSFRAAGSICERNGTER